MNLVFLSHLDRSGSTFLASLLDGHESFSVTIEANFPSNLFGIHDGVLENKGELQNHLNCLYLDAKYQQWDIKENYLLENILINNNFPIRTSDIFVEILKIFTNGSYCNKNGFIVYKGGKPKPSNFLEIQKRFPDAKMIFIARDPRAIFSSQKRAKNILHGFTLESSPQKFSSQWNREVTAAIKQKHSANFYLVKFEDLILNTKVELNNIFSWLNCREIAIDELLKTSSYKKIIPENQKSLHNNISKKPDIHRLNVWKEDLNDTEIGIISESTHELLIEFNYKILNRKYTKKFSTLLQYRYIFKSILIKIKIIYFYFINNNLMDFIKCRKITKDN